MTKVIKTIHYSPSLKLTVLKSEGDGLCGKTGLVSGYAGMITCKVCRELIEEEKEMIHLNRAVAVQQST